MATKISKFNMRFGIVTKTSSNAMVITFHVGDKDEVAHALKEMCYVDHVKSENPVEDFPITSVVHFSAVLDPNSSRPTIWKVVAAWTTRKPKRTHSTEEWEVKVAPLYERKQSCFEIFEGKRSSEAITAPSPDGFFSTSAVKKKPIVQSLTPKSYADLTISHVSRRYVNSVSMNNSNVDSKFQTDKYEAFPAEITTKTNVIRKDVDPTNNSSQDCLESIDSGKSAERLGRLAIEDFTKSCIIGKRVKAASLNNSNEGLLKNFDTECSKGHTVNTAPEHQIKTIIKPAKCNSEEFRIPEVPSVNISNTVTETASRKVSNEKKKIQTMAPVSRKVKTPHQLLPYLFNLKKSNKEASTQTMASGPIISMVHLFVDDT